MCRYALETWASYMYMIVLAKKYMTEMHWASSRGISFLLLVFVCIVLGADAMLTDSFLSNMLTVGIQNVTSKCTSSSWQYKCSQNL